MCLSWDIRITSWIFQNNTIDCVIVHLSYFLRQQGGSGSSSPLRRQGDKPTHNVANMRWQERGGPERDHSVLMELQMNKVWTTFITHWWFIYQFFITFFLWYHLNHWTKNSKDYEALCATDSYLKYGMNIISQIIAFL